VLAAPAGRFRLAVQHHDTPHGRWTMVLALPIGPLAEWVEAVWAAEAFGAFTREEILPRTPTEVLFSLGDVHWLRDPAEPARDRAYTRAFVSGLQQRPLFVESPADSSMAGVRLRPAGAAPFLRDSPAAIAGSVVDLDDLLGAGVESLREQLAAIPDLGHRALALAGAVERHFERAVEPPAAIRFALAELRRTAGQAPIGTLASASGWSHRHFSHRFREEIGLTPKAYARVARFEAAFSRLQALRRVDWAAFALDCGFYDQAHLVNEFRALAGATPTDVFRRLAPDGLGLLVDDERPAP
jgi:AraC-like DNA-binding protein